MALGWQVEDQPVQMVENPVGKRECPLLTLLDTYWELHLELGLLSRLMYI